MLKAVCVYCGDKQARFSGNTHEDSGYRNPCDKCQEITERAKKYGLSLRQYLRLLDAQGYACAICKDPFNDTMPLIDHCHAKGHVRGLLCYRCNCGLGMFCDKISSLESAIHYLQTRRQTTLFQNRKNLRKSTTNPHFSFVENKGT